MFQQEDSASLKSDQLFSQREGGMLNYAHQYPDSMKDDISGLEMQQQQLVRKHRSLIHAIKADTEPKPHELAPIALDQDEWSCMSEMSSDRLVP